MEKPAKNSQPKHGNALLTQIRQSLGDQKICKCHSCLSMGSGKPIKIMLPA
jgi:hypothetical protein